MLMLPLLFALAQDTTASPAATAAPMPTDPRVALLHELTWRSLGPAAFSGRVTAVTVPTGSRTTIYAGSATGGLWRTTNNGTTWRPIADSIGALSIGDVAVAPSDSQVIWVGTGERNSLRSQSWGNGVHKSTDGGRTWTSVGFEQSREIGRIVIHPRDPSIVYVAVLGHLWGTNPDRGVYKTTDGGANWTRVLSVDDTTGFVDLAMDPSNPEVLYAAAWHRIRWGGGHMEGVGAGSGLFRTQDGGRTWTRLTDSTLHNGLPGGARLGRIGIAIHPKYPRIVYAIIQNNQGVQDAARTPYGGLYRSGDAGRSWTRMNDLSAEPFYYYNEVWLDPFDTTHVYLNAAPLYESKDGGASFAPRRLTRVHGDHHTAWFDPDLKGHWLLGSDGGLYETYDGGTSWSHHMLPIGQFYTTTVDTARWPYYVCGGLQDNGTWCGPSATRDRVGITDDDWYPVGGGDGFNVQVAWDDPAIVFSESQFGFMGRLNLRTGERESIRPLAADAGAESGYEFRWGWNTPIIQSQHDSTVLYVGSNHLIRLLDRGRNWELVGPDMTRANRANPDPTPTWTSYQALFSIAESPRSADILWTGSDDGLIWVTRDRGRTWTNVTDHLPAGVPTRCFVSSIAASYHVDGRAYVTLDCHRRDDYAPHVFATEDFGNTWSEIDAGLDPQWGSLSILEDARNPDLLFVGTETGIRVSLDRGTHWHTFGRGMPPVGVRMMSQVHRTRELVVGSFGRGMYILPIGVLEELSDSALAGPAHLFQVDPARQFRTINTHPSWGSRPFVADNPPDGAVITYWLRDSADQDVRLEIADSSGTVVQRLTGRGYPGLHRVTWDLDLSSTPPRGLGESDNAQERRQVPAGRYTVTLRVAGKTMKQDIVVMEGWPTDPVGRLR